MIGAGTMNNRVAFDAPTGTVTPTGGQVTDWVEQISGVWAAIRYLRGSETVIAARLTGRQPAVVRVRASAATKEITTDWRMRDVRTGAIYAIKTIVPTDDRQFLELTCETGLIP